MLFAQVTLRQLEYFVATVELGTFAAAAARFHVSPAAVSLSATDMEKALGVQLLVRRRAKGPTLTPAGVQVLMDARRVLAHAGDLESAARSVGQQIGGRLVIGCFPTISPYILGRILEGVPQRHPGLEIEFVEDTVEGLQRRLREGSCEVAIMYDIGIEPGIDITPLYPCAPYAVLPRSHPVAADGSVRIASLIDEPMIMIDMPPSAEFFLSLLERAGHRPWVRHRANGIETVRSLVGRGMGWSLLLHRPQTDVSYDGSNVLSAALSDLTATIDVVAARPADVKPTRRVEAFIAYCLEELDVPSPHTAAPSRTPRPRTPAKARS